MNASPGAPQPDDRVPDDATPAAALGGIWDVLDALPRPPASPTLTATTLERVALAVEKDTAPLAAARMKPGRSRRRWIGAVAAVGAALGAGIVAGRITAPDADAPILDDLPLVQHLDLLREAGSVRFLEEVARRSHPPPPPPPERREGWDKEARDYRAEVATLQDRLAASGTGPQRLRERRARVADMPLEARVELDQSVEAFQGMSATERRALQSLAQALVDPGRPELRDAALAWHQWLATSRPETRPDIIARGTDQRLEWLDYYAQQGPRPPRDWNRGERRPFPPPGPEGRPRRPGGRNGPPGERPRAEDPPEPPGSRRGPPPFRPPRGASPPADAGETPAPPR